MLGYVIELGRVYLFLGDFLKGLNLRCWIELWLWSWGVF